MYGETGGLEWKQEDPNYLYFTNFGKPSKKITRGSSSASKEANDVTRIPPGHPEGYLEAFAQLYSDFAELIRNSKNKNKIKKILPNEEDGLHIMKFINSCVNSSNQNSRWINLNS